MRHHQPYETDGARHAHRRARGHGHEREDQGPRTEDVHAGAHRVLLAERERIDHAACGRTNVAPRGALRRAEQPVEDLVHAVVRRADDHDGDQRRAEAAHRDARQKQGAGGRPARCARDQVDHQHGDDRSKKREQRKRGRPRECPAAHVGRHGADRRACRHAEQARRRERILQAGLERGPRDGQRSPGEHEHPRHAEVEDDDLRHARIGVERRGSHEHAQGIANAESRGAPDEQRAEADHERGDDEQGNDEGSPGARAHGASRSAAGRWRSSARRSAVSRRCGVTVVSSRGSSSTTRPSRTARRLERCG